MLSSASEYFSSLFNDTTKNFQKPIIIDNVNDRTLALLVLFCYTGRLEITWKNALNFYAAAKDLKFPQIERKIMLFFRLQLLRKPDSGIDIFSTAAKYNDDHLMKETINLISDRLHILIKTPAFLNMDYTVLKQFLEGNRRGRIMEMKILEAAVNWVNFKKEEREAHVLDILKLIRLKEMDYAVEYSF